MGTTDANGIYFYETTDPVSPLQTLLNTGQQSVSNAINTRARYTKAVAASPPTTPTPVLGDLWYETNTGILNVYTGTIWQAMTGSYTGTIGVPAFSLPVGVPAVSLVSGAAISHPFKGAVVVEASLAGDAAVGANTSVKFSLAVNSTTRYSWVQNFGAGTLRDTPAAIVLAYVPAGTASLIYVSASDIGSGGTSATTNSLVVDYTVRPA